MRRLIAHLRVARRDDRGAASVLVLGLIVALMVVAGLVVDGGRAVNARAEIMDDAEQAARAGANEIDMASLRSGGAVRVDPVRAQEAARAYLTARGYDGARITVRADQAEVTVTASDDVATALLSLAFIHSFEVQGSASARAAVGIDREITGGP